MGAEPVISFSGVSFGYGPHKVLEDVSFDIYKRDYLAVIGPNGGGKTTLLKLLLGLLQPQQGSIEILGLPPGKKEGRWAICHSILRFLKAFPSLSGMLFLWARFPRD